MKKVFFVLPSHDQLGNTGKKQDSAWKNLLVPSLNSLITDTIWQLLLQSADNLLWIQRVIWKSGKPNLQQRFQKDKSAQEKLANTLVLSQVSASDYDTLFLPGGHGPSGIYQ